MLHECFVRLSCRGEADSPLLYRSCSPVDQLVVCTIFAICPNGSEGAKRLNR
jgi:hypothetical protein